MALNIKFQSKTKIDMWITSIFKKRMSLRDQFAMSAPDVPEWYEPECTERTYVYPDITLLYGLYSNEPLKYLMIYYNEESDDMFIDYPQSETDNVKYLKSKIEKTMETFRLKRQRSRLDCILNNASRLTRWKYFYADAMMRRRCDPISEFDLILTDQYDTFRQITSMD